MSATPGASNEYSRGSGASNGGTGGEFRPSRRGIRRVATPPSGPTAAVILGGALLGALLLLVSEFTALYHVHIATRPTALESVSGGSNNSYAMVPIALLAGALAVVVWRIGSRPALLAIGLVGLVALLISLLGDLPDAHATGLAGSATTHYVNASATPSAGLYMETLGAVLLIATCGLGFMLLGAPARQGPGPRPGRPVPTGRDS